MSVTLAEPLLQPLPRARIRPHDTALLPGGNQAAALLCMSDVFAYITTTEELKTLWATP